MSAVLSPHITAVMIAAADLENAEFECDRLAVVCAETIRQALAGGLTPPQIASAADLAEGEVLRLAEVLSPGGDGAVGTPGPSGLAGGAEPFLVGLRPSGADAVYPEASRTQPADVATTSGRGSDAVL
jgi:hypothetical protein